MYMVRLNFKYDVPKHFLFENDEKFVEKYRSIPGLDISNVENIVCKEVPENLLGLDRATMFNKMVKLF